MESQEGAFRDAMVEIYIRAKNECNYNATRFFQMLDERGGLATAKTLLHAQVSDGYTALWELGRLDLSVEAYVLRPEFQTLFTSEELEIARTRLKEDGYPAGMWAGGANKEYRRSPSDRRTSRTFAAIVAYAIS